MKTRSVLLIQILTVLICIIAPLSLLFGFYMHDEFSLSVAENAKMSQSNVQYAASNLSLFKEMIVTEAARIASADYVQQLSGILKYQDVLKSAQIQNQLNSTVSRLASAQYADIRLKSVYLYQLSAEYVLTSDKGVQQIDDFDDVGWLQLYEDQVEEYNLSHLGFWASREVPEVDIARYGAIGQPERVISYVYGLTPALSKIYGILTMNFDMDAIAQLINEGLGDTDSVMLLINDQGTVICHPDSERIGENWGQTAAIQKILTSSSLSGSFTVEGSNDLYAYCNAGIDDWILVSVHSSRPFVAQTLAVSMRYLIYLLACLLVGGLTCYFILNRILSPVKAIVKKLNRADVPLAPSNNEFQIISHALSHLQQQESTLHRLLDSSHESVRQLTLKKLLDGTVDHTEVGIAWPHRYFVTVLFCVDNARAFRQEATRQERRSFRLECIGWVDEHLSAPGMCMGIELDECTVAAVVNSDLDEDLLMTELVRLLERSRGALTRSVSVGIGSIEDEQALLALSLRNARMALRERLRAGHGSISVWHESLLSPIHDSYPVELEQRLRAALDTVHPELTLDILVGIRENLALLPSDDIEHAMYRLMDVLLEYLQDYHLEMQALLPDNLPISGPGDIETLDEFIVMLHTLTNAIMAQALAKQAQSSYIAGISSYIETHFTHDIDFEQMAAEIGISYSYMRRIAHEHLHTSLLDMVHRVRIEQAKMLLVKTDMPVKVIAAQIGYTTTQSFERFFRKFNHMTATDYRNSQANAE